MAITAGLDHADAAHTIIMACDLQDDPAAIPAIVEAARTTGADLVLTRRMQRQDPLSKRLLARIFYAVVQFFVKVRYDHRVGNYRCLSRLAVQYFREYRERTRNVNAIMAIMRVRTTTIDVQHQPRAASTSTYSTYRSAELAFHVLVGYSEVPLQLVVILGVTVIAVSLGRLGWLAWAPADIDRAVQAIATGTALLRADRRARDPGHRHRRRLSHQELRRVDEASPSTSWTPAAACRPDASQAGYPAAAGV